MENLASDIEILKRDYSVFRISSKWRSYRFSSKSLELDSLAEVYIKITRPSIAVVDYYTLPSLQKRQEIKRSASLLSEIQKLWLGINPGNLRAISKQVYLVVVESLYTQFKIAQGNPNVVPVCLAQDTDIDFKDRANLTFAEFYDIIFEIIDSLSKSTLVSEYSRLVFLNKVNLLNSEDLISLNLYSKLHLSDTYRVSFHQWMQKSSRFPSPDRLVKLPEISKVHSTPSLAPKFLSRIKVRVMRDNMPIKWDLQKLIDRKARSPARSITPLLSSLHKSSSSKKVENKKKSPFSITPIKERKSTFLLEEIIEERSKLPALGC
jgi:hypothetical protein